MFRNNIIGNWELSQQQRNHIWWAVFQDSRYFFSQVRLEAGERTKSRLGSIVNSLHMQIVPQLATTPHQSLTPNESRKRQAVTDVQMLRGGGDDSDEGDSKRRRRQRGKKNEDSNRLPPNKAYGTIDNYDKNIKLKWSTVKEQLGDDTRVTDVIKHVKDDKGKPYEIKSFAKKIKEGQCVVGTVQGFCPTKGCGFNHEFETTKEDSAFICKVISDGLPLAVKAKKNE